MVRAGGGQGVFDRSTIGPEQVGIYHRWFRWLTEVVLKDRDFVLVNMDETGVGHVQKEKKGYSVNPAGDEHRQFERFGTDKSGVDYTDMKTSLLGVVCSDPTVQPHLPQFVLPKYRAKKLPPQYLLESYERMGYPLIIKHGTTGWNDEETMKEFLLELRTVIYSIDPKKWILLVLDDARCHVSRAMLNYIKILGFLVIVIPARLTWLLQMLDVYVFAEFKRRLRRATTAALLATPTGSLGTGGWVPLLGQTCQEVLVRADWQRTFSRCGLTHDLNLVRESVRYYLNKVTNRTPARPTEEELLDVLSLPARARPIFPTWTWRSLLTAFPQTLLEEPTRRPYVAARKVLPAGVQPSEVLSEVFEPVAPVPLLPADGAAAAPAAAPTGPAPVASASCRKRALSPDPLGNSIASRTRSRTQAKAKAAPGSGGTAAGSAAAASSKD